MLSPLLSYISHFRRFYARQFEPAAAKYGLSQLEIDILLFLHNNPERNTARDIVEMRGFAKSNVSNAVESLRQKGYLAAEPDPGSRKMRRLTLRQEMGGRTDELAALQSAVFTKIFQGFSADERKPLCEFHKRIDQNLLSALDKNERTR